VMILNYCSALLMVWHYCSALESSATVYYPVHQGLLIWSQSRQSPLRRPVVVPLIWLLSWTQAVQARLLVWAALGWVIGPKAQSECCHPMK
jgi:hypothetical protein